MAEKQDEREAEVFVSCRMSRFEAPHIHIMQRLAVIFLDQGVQES